MVQSGDDSQFRKPYSGMFFIQDCVWYPDRDVLMQCVGTKRSAYNFRLRDLRFSEDLTSMGTM
jgi:hypothetical protein